MERNFRLRGLQRKARVPDAAVRSAETAALRLRVRESGIDDVKMRHAKDEFVNRDSGKQVSFARQSFVGGVVELDTDAPSGPEGGRGATSTLSPLEEAIRDQAVRVVLLEMGRLGGHRAFKPFHRRDVREEMIKHLGALCVSERGYNPPRRASSN